MLVYSFSCPSSVLVNKIYCSVKYCCSNSTIPGVILLSIMKSIKTPNHPAYHWSTLWPLEVWVGGLHNSWWFCVHKLSMFFYLSMENMDPSHSLYLMNTRPSYYLYMENWDQVILYTWKILDQVILYTWRILDQVIHYTCRILNQVILYTWRILDQVILYTWRILDTESG